MHYDLRLRPAQPVTPASDAFEIDRREVAPSEGRDGLSVAFVHEAPKDGAGYPLVLLHGYPETKRIWWRNITPLADAGYEVIARPAGLWRLRRVCRGRVRPGRLEP